MVINAIGGESSLNLYRLKRRGYTKILYEKVKEMILYHISFDLNKDGHFVPRVPPHTLSDEDQKTLRVCVSDSLKGAISGCSISYTKLEHDTKPSSKFVKIFKINTEKLGIDANAIVSAQALKESGKVADAILTREHWILDPFTVPDEDIEIIMIQTWEGFERDMDEDENAGSMYILETLAYVPDNVLEGQEAYFPTVDRSDSENLFQQLNSNFDVDVISKWDFEVHVKFLKSAFLRDVFMNRWNKFSQEEM